MAAPILIYGPTASGKSSIALKLAQHLNGVIVNADALQVYSNWRVLSARPSDQDLLAVPHHLYGHVAPASLYSAGHWLTELENCLMSLSQTVLVVGGTGLYFSAATEGLANIPQTPDEIRKAGNLLRETEGAAGLCERLQQLDPAILIKIDKQNPMRLQRAWEVATATGRPLSDWQANTQPPLIPPRSAHTICLNAPVDWQRARIDTRFEQMVENGALLECQAALDAGWNPNLPSSRAIGAEALIAHLRGEIGLDDAITLAKTQTHQYAKRQRTWAKKRMKTWFCHESNDPNLFETILEQIENSAPKEPLNF